MLSQSSDIETALPVLGDKALHDAMKGGRVAGLRSEQPQLVGGRRAKIGNGDSYLGDGAGRGYRCGEFLEGGCKSPCTCRGATQRQALLPVAAVIRYHAQTQTPRFKASGLKATGQFAGYAGQGVGQEQGVVYRWVEVTVGFLMPFGCLGTRGFVAPAAGQPVEARDVGAELFAQSRHW